LGGDGSEQPLLVAEAMMEGAAGEADLCTDVLPRFDRRSATTRLCRLSPARR
jgi:hypothetical protein